MSDRPMRSGWTLLIGIALVIIGLAFLLVPMLTTIAAGLAAGGLLVVAGAAQALHALFQRDRGWGWSLLVGILAILAGAMLLADPMAGVIGITLLLAIFLLATGAMKMVVGAMWSPVPGWGWLLFNGAITVVLGILVLSGWPATGLWTIGVFLGVDALLAGFSGIVHALAEAPSAGPMIPTPPST